MFKYVARSIFLALPLSSLTLGIAGCVVEPDEAIPDALSTEVPLSPEALVSHLCSSIIYAGNGFTLESKWNEGGFQQYGCAGCYGYVSPSITFKMGTPPPAPGTTSVWAYFKLRQPSTGWVANCGNPDYSAPYEPECSITLPSNWQQDKNFEVLAVEVVSYSSNGVLNDTWYPFGNLTWIPVTLN